MHTPKFVRKVGQALWRGMKINAYYRYAYLMVLTDEERYEKWLYEHRTEGD